LKRIKIRLSLLLCLAVVVTAPSAVYATDGYFSHGYGTKAKGMAGAGVALPQEGLSASVNPAGMVLVGNRFEIGGALFDPQRQYTVSGAPSGAQGTFGLFPGTVSSGRDLFGIPHLAMNRMQTPDSSFGVTIYGNGGMNTTYPASASDGAGTFYSGQAGVNLEQLFVQPTYARRLNGRLSVGLGVLLAYQRFEARGLDSLASFVSDGTADCLCDRGDDHSFGLGARLGVLYEAAPRLTLGAAYQTQTTMGKFNKYADLFAGQGSFDIPAAATVGLAWKTSSTSALALDVQHIWYSAVHSIGNPLANLMNARQQDDPSQMLGGSNGAGFGWRDMTIYKLGYQWQSGPNWTLRTGVSYGRQPVPSSEALFNILAPGVQEWHFTAGFTKKTGPRSEFSLAAMYSPGKTVTGPNPFDAPGQQTISLKMQQFEVEASYALKF
jgi:long-chain fatty acid transport protein